MIEQGLGKIQKSPVTWFLFLIGGLLIVGTMNAVNLWNQGMDNKTSQIATQAQVEQLKAAIQQIAQAQAVQAQAARDQTANLDRRLTLVEEREAKK